MIINYSDIKVSDLGIDYNLIIDELAPYNIDVILDRFSKVELTEEHVMDGQSGIARALIPCLINDDGKKMLRCIDAFKGIFITVDEHKNIIIDTNARNLALDIYSIAIEKTNKVIMDYKNKFYLK